MATFVNRAKVSTSTTGTGTITLGAAEDGYQTFAAAGVGDGDSVRYTIEDGNNWEIGTGTYTATGTTLSRTPSESSNAGAAINLSGDAVVFVTALATDFTSPTYTNLTTTGSVDFSGATVSDLGTVTTANIDGGDIASAVTINKSPTVTLTGAITGSGTLTNLGNVSIATTATSDPTLTMAGDITGSATFTNLGNATLTATVVGGDVDTAAAWTTARTLSLTGAVTGSVSIDGSANASIATTATSDPTLTLSGDATGSATFTNLGNATLAVTVVGGDVDTATSATTATTATTANAWTTARTVSLTGAVTGSASVDGSANVSIATTATSDPTLTLAGDVTGSATFTNLGNATLTATVVDDSHNHIIGNVDGLQTALDGKLPLSGGTISGDLTVTDTIFWQVSGADTARQRADARDDATNFSRLHWYGMSDTGATSNFRHAWYDGATYVNVTVNSSGRIDFTGSAASMYIGSDRVFDDGYHPNADKWTTARTLSLTGAVTGSASVDGSANVSIATTATSDPTITLTGAVTGSGTMTNLGNVSITTTATSDPTLTLAGDATGSATFTNLGNATLTVAVVNDSHTHAFNNLTSKTGGTGTYYTSGSMNAAQLYGGTSSTLTGAGQLSLLASDPYIAFYPGSSTTRNGYIQKVNTGNYFFFGEEAYVNCATSFRAPVFYDSDNSGYYTDPAGTSVFNVVSGNRIYAGYDSGSANSMSCSNWFRSSGSTGWYNQTYAGGIYMEDSTYVRVYGSKIFYADNYILSGSSIRGPIFYDSGNTAYYTDPAATSVMNNIRLEGVIDHNGDTNTYIQFHAADQFRVVTGGSERLEVNNTATTGIRIDATSDMRAPIFYDSNNTAYYTNPASTSLLASLDVATSMEIPSGTTASRPASPAAGNIRYNTTEGVFEGYDGSDWRIMSSGLVDAIQIEYIIVAGGGGGGGSISGTSNGGGGGAGGYRASISGEGSGGGATAETPLDVTLGTAYTLTVGAGASTTPAATIGGNGSNSVLSTITATGGGGGGHNVAGAAGGSGGGGGGVTSGAIRQGGAGTSLQGYAGGRGTDSGVGAGGGGGAGQTGYPGSGNVGGAGGSGVSSSVTGTATTRAGGGGACGGAGGSGGGGAGGNFTNGSPGTANTGGGGGGAQGDASRLGGAGGSGVIILKIPSANSASFSAGVTQTSTTVGSYKIYTVTAAGASDTVTFS